MARMTPKAKKPKQSLGQEEDERATEEKINESRCATGISMGLFDSGGNTLLLK